MLSVDKEFLGARSYGDPEVRIKFLAMKFSRLLSQKILLWFVFLHRIQVCGKYICENLDPKLKY